MAKDVSMAILLGPRGLNPAAAILTNFLDWSLSQKSGNFSLNNQFNFTTEFTIQALVSNIA